MKHVVSKVSRPNYIPIIEKLGVDVAVNPVTITASEILGMYWEGKWLPFRFCLAVWRKPWKSLFSQKPM
jgi:hypothetical protein